MEDPKNIKFRLLSITNEKTTSSLEGKVFSSITEGALQFQYKIKTVFKLTENTITVIPSIRYLLGDTALLESCAEFNFAVVSLDAVMDVDKENKKLSMKVNIIPTLLSSAYSSLRGIVYARTLATPLEKYPVPMVDIDTLLSKNGISILE